MSNLMTGSRIDHLYLYKKSAVTHIENKKYSWAMVYLRDALSHFEEALEEVNNED